MTSRICVGECVKIISEILPEETTYYSNSFLGKETHILLDNYFCIKNA